MLELGDNKLRVIENLDALVNLTHLYLGKNKIKKIDNLDKLTNLRCISLQANRIVKLENLDKLVNLTELYISENGIEKIEGLEQNKLLETLDLAKNRLTSIDNTEHLEHLEEFWVRLISTLICHFRFLTATLYTFCSLSTQANSNQIADWSNVNKLQSNKQLQTVYLEHNPLWKDVQYRMKIKLALPWLQKIDATLCR